MKHTHTPGPWQADIYCVWSGEIFVCGTQTGLPVERQIANARLIASAPDLLAELERTDASLTAILCSRVIDSTTSTWLELRRNRDAIRSAIARATGGNA